jgi:hypothetical protein
MTTPPLHDSVQATDPGHARAPLLVIAHPGHELRILGWMGRMRPLVCVLTDGSGSRDEGRLESTTRVLEHTGATAGPVYGVMSDKEVYAAILGHDHDRFTRLADDLAGVIASIGADCVVGDAIEGYNPSHDVCRLVINAAVRMASRGAAAPANYDYLLVGPPGECAVELRDRAYFLELDDAALDDKLQAARCYPELTAEVDHALDKFGLAPFRTECLRPSDHTSRYGWDPAVTPYYETFGEQRVAAGVYKDVLRFREHVMPLADALWTHSERGA